MVQMCQNINKYRQNNSKESRYSLQLINWLQGSTVLPVYVSYIPKIMQSYDRRDKTDQSQLSWLTFTQTWIVWLGATVRSTSSSSILAFDDHLEIY